MEAEQLTQENALFVIWVMFSVIFFFVFAVCEFFGGEGGLYADKVHLNVFDDIAKPFLWMFPCLPQRFVKCLIAGIFVGIFWPPLVVLGGFGCIFVGGHECVWWMKKKGNECIEDPLLTKV